MKLLHQLALSSAAIAVATASQHANSGSGFYVGLNAGAGITKNQVAITGAGTFANQKNPVCGLADVVVGYSHDLSSGFVIGGEAYVGTGFGKKEIAQAGAVPNVFVGGMAIAGFSIKQSRGLYYGFAVRAGYRFIPQLLGYVKAGIEGGQFKHSYYNATTEVAATTTALNAAGFTDAAMQHTLVALAKVSGVRPKIGAGLEYAFTKNIAATLDYGFMFALSKNARTATNAEDSATKFKYSQHSIKVGVKYTF
jgi:opacity protein-like surface antigen